MNDPSHHVNHLQGALAIDDDVAVADARSIVTASGRDGAAVDGDVAARGIVVGAADARSPQTAIGRDGAAANDDVAAIGSFAAADARSIVTSSGRDGAATDGDVAARLFGSCCRCPHHVGCQWR